MIRSMLAAILGVAVLAAPALARNKYMMAPTVFRYARGTVGINAGGAVTVTFASGDERTWGIIAHNQHTDDLIVCGSSVNCGTATTPVVNSAGSAWTVSENIAIIEPGQLVELDFKDTGIGARMAVSTGPAAFWAVE